MAKFFLKQNPGGGVHEEAKRRREVRRYFDRADKNRDGKLTKEEWYHVLNGSGVPTTMDEVEDFFNAMDRDFDGRLSFQEFMGEESAIEKLFKSMDTNGDGFVTKEEFRSICKNLNEDQVAEAFLKFDKTGDDRLNYREFCMMINLKQQEAEN